MHDAVSRAADPLLSEGYARCRELTRRHGTTYYWGARLLPLDQRRDVYAVYALCRLADDIVDEPETVQVPVPADADPGVRLRNFEAFFTTAEGCAAFESVAPPGGPYVAADRVGELR